MKLIVFNAEKTRNSFIHDLKRSFWSSERWRSARWIYKRVFFVHNLIKYGQYRSIKVNQVQLRLIRVNWGMSICQSVHLLVAEYSGFWVSWSRPGLSTRMRTRTRTHCTHRFFERRLRERLRDAMKLGYAYADAYAILWKKNIAS